MLTHSLYHVCNWRPVRFLPINSTLGLFPSLRACKEQTFCYVSGRGALIRSLLIDLWLIKGKRHLFLSVLSCIHGPVGVSAHLRNVIIDLRSCCVTSMAPNSGIKHD